MISKYKSRRFLITVWSIIVLTVSLIMEYEPSWMILIAGVPVTFIGFESNNKKYYRKNDE